MQIFSDFKQLALGLVSFSKKVWGHCLNIFILTLYVVILAWWFLIVGSFLLSIMKRSVINGKHDYFLNSLQSGVLQNLSVKAEYFWYYCGGNMHECYFGYCLSS
jgi:hypothetical protein